MEIEVITKNIVTKNKNYPIYIGFLEAEKILEIAQVPNYNKNAANKDIANNLTQSPVIKWQRPLIPEKRDDIASIFNHDDDKFMPNPVLISTNDTYQTN